MVTSLYYIVLPGLEYVSKGPLWVDKIEITADINGKKQLLIPLTSGLLEFNFTDTITLYNNGVDYKDTIKETEDGLKHSIESMYASASTIYANEETVAIGLCAIPFYGGSTDIVTFKAVLYTSKNWNSSDEITYICTSDSASEYKEIETIEIKYSPFIVLSENAEVFPEDWATQNINTVDIQSAAKKCCSAFNLNQNVNTIQSIYLDGSINATVPYDELPMVRMINTPPPYNRCIKDWCDYGHLENIQEIVNSDTCYFLLFDHNLPKKFGKNEFTDDNDKLAICAYRKSIDGQVARQRYSLVGVTKTLDNPNLIWRGQYSYDFTSFDESVKYYSSRPFTVSITAQMSNKVDISYNLPDKLYTTKTDGLDDVFVLLSGCSWQALIDTCGKIDKACTYDVPKNNDFLLKHVWTHSTNNGVSLPPIVQKMELEPKLAGEGTYYTISSSNGKTLKLNLDLDIIIPQLSAVLYLTFVDSDYSKRKFDKLILATTQLNHPVEKSYIQVDHTPTTFTLNNPNESVELDVDVTGIPTASNYEIATNLQFKSINKTDNTIYSFPIEDSADGSIPVSSTLDSSEFTITKSGTVSVYTANGSLDHEAENAYLLTDGSLTITCSDTSGSYILKWTQIPTDYSGVPHLEKYLLDTITNSYAIMENGTGVIKGKQLLVGSIAVIPVDNAQLVDGLLVPGTLSLVHSLGCYEDVALFNNQLHYNKIYFPPSNTMCVGFYKITSSPTIDVKDVKMLYNDTPNKNEIIINGLIGTQYKKSRL